MKKSFFTTAFLTLTFAAFTACENVPAPYEIPTKPIEEITTPDVFIDESFTSTLGSFTNYTSSGASEWKIDFKTAKASGYNFSTKTTTAGTYYLVSSELDFTNVEAAHLTFDYILRYIKESENQQLLISDKFDTAQPAENWTLLNQNWTEGKDWTTFTNYTLNLPKEWLGKKVRIAFKYSTNDQSGSTWEIKNLKLQKGAADVVTPQPPVAPEQPDTPNAPDTPVAPTGNNLLTNGDFENWANNAPTNWRSTTTASTATLSQSTTAHGGQFAVKVEGDPKQNKRIAYKELTLKAGHYTMAFYVRAENNGASCRPGYTTPNKKEMTYQYGKYTNDIAANQWTLVTHSFTLEQNTPLNLIVLNPRGKGNLLIDDFTLTTTDGGIAD